MGNSRRDSSGAEHGRCPEAVWRAPVAGEDLGRRRYGKGRYGSRPITVAELVRVPRPQTTFPQRSRVPGVELQTFLVRARFVSAHTQDDDSDIHVIVRDVEVPDAMLLTEIPHPGCTADERLARVYDEARRALRTVPRDAIIEVVGLGFFDTLHGQ